MLDALPINANGKIDRRALPVPDASELAKQYVAPRTELEVHLAAIWQAVLGVPRVGLDDGFFELGGHSLMATRVTSRILQELGAVVPLRTIFEAPRLGGFADRVQAMLGAPAAPTWASPPIERVDPDRRSRPLPLSFAQERQWFLWRLESGEQRVPHPGRGQAARPGAARGARACVRGARRAARGVAHAVRAGRRRGRPGDRSTGAHGGGRRGCEWLARGGGADGGGDGGGAAVQSRARAAVARGAVPARRGRARAARGAAPRGVRRGLDGGADRNSAGCTRTLAAVW